MIFQAFSWDRFVKVLSMRSFNRGPPLVPQPKDNQDMYDM